jgi:hypothetical protein
VLVAGNWKLLGAPLAYYVFDNAVLWAAFRAYGNAPPLGVIVMGYLVGSLATAAPFRPWHVSTQRQVLGGRARWVCSPPRARSHSVPSISIRSRLLRRSMGPSPTA